MGCFYSQIFDLFGGSNGTGSATVVGSLHSLHPFSSRRFDGGGASRSKRVRLQRAMRAIHSRILENGESNWCRGRLRMGLSVGCTRVGASRCMPVRNICWGVHSAVRRGAGLAEPFLPPSTARRHPVLCLPYPTTESVCAVSVRRGKRHPQSGLALLVSHRHRPRQASI